MRREVWFVLLVLAGSLVVPRPAGATHEVDSRCVQHADGSLRQTEDPLSPDCRVWDGHDNGGSTATGVTEDEVRVVLYGQGVPVDDTRYCDDYDPRKDSQIPNDWDSYHFNLTVHRLLEYFNTRMETYGRRVCLYGINGQLNESKAQQEGGALQIEAMDPFAVVFFGNSAPYLFAALAERGIPVFGLNQDVPASVYEDNAPFVWSFVPDMETQTDNSAGFICRKLVGGTARLSRDPLLKDQPRRIGLIYGQGAYSHLEQEAQILIERVAARCGLEFDTVLTYPNAGSLGAGTTEALPYMLAMKVTGVTTVVCYCVPVESTVTAMQQAADRLLYFPEWYWDNASYMDRGIWQQVYGSKTQVSIGSTYRPRQPAFRDQFHYRAFKQVDPQGEPNTRHSWTLYTMLMNLFAAVQLSGEELTVENAEAGLRGYARRDGDNPFLAVGGYDVDHPSPQTFVDTAMGWWWDPTGTPPGGKTAEGCMRVANEGRRETADTWPLGDADLLVPDAPCSEDAFKLTGAQSVP